VVVVAGLVGLELVGVSSHWWDDARHDRDAVGECGKEELYVSFSATYRGREITFKVSADRYRHVCVRDGERPGEHATALGEWRIVPRDLRGMAGMSDGLRKAIRADVEPLVVAWLASGAYDESREGAVLRCVQRILREVRTEYDVSRADVVAREQLSGEALARAVAAVRAVRASLVALGALSR
jgi:hypothetical protein